MLLSELLSDLSYTATGAIDGVAVDDIVYDSRKAGAGKMFVCLVGAATDGHQYAPKAYAAGCRILMVERILPFPDDVLQIVTENTRIGLAAASSALFGHPSRSLLIIGVTGTKGKTTTASLIADIMNDSGIDTAYIGTTGIVFHGNRTPTVNTTPESYELHSAFRKMCDAGVSCVVMEVSSQAMYRHRVYGIHFHIGVFTNLSPDHIGGCEHPTFEHYMSCKAAMFRQCRYGIFNADDNHYFDMVKDAPTINTTFGIESSGHFNQDITAYHVKPWKEGNKLGVSFDCRFMTVSTHYRLSMPGEYNVYNALAAIAVAKRMQIPDSSIQKSLAKAAVRGRFEIVDSGRDDVVTIIDYAHNALSMKSALEAIRRYQPKRLVVLFGSVGGRTEMRRAEMGEIAAKYADFVIVTSDNPDSEPPENIIHDIEAAILKTSCPYVTFVDRREAVYYAMSHALSGDVILFAGKGHEDYQIVNGEHIPYDEREEILKAKAELTQKAIK